MQEAIIAGDATFADGTTLTFVYDLARNATVKRLFASREAAARADLSETTLCRCRRRTEACHLATRDGRVRLNAVVCRHCGFIRDDGT